MMWQSIVICHPSGSSAISSSYLDDCLRLTNNLTSKVILDLLNKDKISFILV